MISNTNDDLHTYLFTICVQIIQFRRSAVSNRIECKYVHIAKHLPFLKSAAFPTRSEFHVSRREKSDDCRVQNSGQK